MQENTNNKRYWEEYVTYWENKVKDANLEKSASDKTSTDDMMAKQVGRLNISASDIFLDYGCGSGRFYYYYCKMCGSNKNYYGVDISRTALEHALSRYKDMNEKQLKETDGVTIPFNDATFDKICCYGVFDACDQERTLAELIRVLKKDGLLFLSGKNDNYNDDDEAAFEAEVNSRKKKHPNSFTDILKMIDELQNMGIEVVAKYFFERRGDVQKDKFFSETSGEKKFYEWQVIIKKTNMDILCFDKFSDAYSKTYIRRR